MNQEVKAKWLTALRSGEYRQGKWNLHNQDNTFCCLGVLTDLYIKEHAGAWEKYDSSTKHCYEFGEETTVLPQVVIKWAGLDNCIPSCNDCSLASRNDTYCQSFNEIANLIEQHL